MPLRFATAVGVVLVMFAFYYLTLNRENGGHPKDKGDLTLLDPSIVRKRVKHAEAQPEAPLGHAPEDVTSTTRQGDTDALVAIDRKRLLASIFDFDNRLRALQDLEITDKEHQFLADEGEKFARRMAKLARERITIDPSRHLPALGVFAFRLPAFQAGAIELQRFKDTLTHKLGQKRAGRVVNSLLGQQAYGSYGQLETLIRLQPSQDDELFEWEITSIDPASGKEVSQSWHKAAGLEWLDRTLGPIVDLENEAQ